jgi:hypothetical protein
MAIDIGLIAYLKYTEQTGEVADWSQVDKVHQDAWRHAAVAVSQYLTAERERWEKDKAEDNEAFPIDW